MKHPTLRSYSRQTKTLDTEYSTMAVPFDQGTSSCAYQHGGFCSAPMRTPTPPLLSFWLAYCTIEANLVLPLTSCLITSCTSFIWDTFIHVTLSFLFESSQSTLISSNVLLPPRNMHSFRSTRSTWCHSPGRPSCFRRARLIHEGLGDRHILLDVS